MFELILILGIALLVWFLIKNTNIVKNINDLFSGKIGLSEEQQEISEFWEHGSPLIGEYKEVLLKHPPATINMFEPSPSVYVDREGEGGSEIPNRVLNKGFKFEMPDTVGKNLV